MLAVYFVMKTMDLSGRSAIPLLFEPRMETYLFWLEILVGVVGPLILFSIARVRENPRGLFTGAVMIIIGFILNRMNISITGMEAWAGVSYFPSWMEISVTIAIVTARFVVFYLAAKYLPLFRYEPQSITIGSYDFEEDLKLISEETTQKSANEILTGR